MGWEQEWPIEEWGASRLTAASSPPEHAALQPFPLLPPWHPQFPCNWGPPLASGQVQLLLVQGQH